MYAHIHKLAHTSISNAVSNAQLDNVIPSGINLKSVTVRFPDKNNISFDTNVAFVIGKQIKQDPADIALILNPYIQTSIGAPFLSVNITKKGHIGFNLYDGIWYNEIIKILSEGLSYGNSNIGQYESINIEYVSANPTGPLHIGHARGAVFGDVLANLLTKVGYKVTKEYYINDVGAQVDKLAHTLMHRYKEQLGYDMGEIPEGLYPGEYLIDAAKFMVVTYGDQYLYMDINSAIADMKLLAIQNNMFSINDDLESLGIHFDEFTSENHLHENGEFASVMELIDNNELTYTGRLPPPKSGKADDWEDTDLLLFKSTQFGDDIDRPLKKSDGNWTYFAGDIAYHYHKYNRGFKKMINVWGADHGGYVKRMKAAVNAITNNSGNLDIKLCQTVHFMKDGKPFVLSKRNGTYITLKDLIDEVGPDVVRFTFLTRKNDSQFTFDLDKVVEKSKENPVWYIQYSHARTYSVLNSAINAGINIEAAKVKFKNNTALLSEILYHVEEYSIIQKLAEWPHIVEMSANALEPHRISTYMHELSGMFHSYWTLGNKNKNFRIIDTDYIERSQARLLLVEAINTVIHSGLRIFGVTPLNEM